MTYSNTEYVHMPQNDLHQIEQDTANMKKLDEIKNILAAHRDTLKKKYKVKT